MKDMAFTGSAKVNLSNEEMQTLAADIAAQLV
jgi:hypothetical protein